jgi:hypothetical protein
MMSIVVPYPAAQYPDNYINCESNTLHQAGISVDSSRAGVQTGARKEFICFIIYCSHQAGSQSPSQQQQQLNAVNFIPTEIGYYIYCTWEYSH